MKRYQTHIGPWKTAHSENIFAINKVSTANQSEKRFLSLEQILVHSDFDISKFHRAIFHIFDFLFSTGYTFTNG